MKLRHIAFFAGLLLTSVFGVKAEMDTQGYPVMYLRGEMTDTWSCKNEYKFTRSGNEYTLTLSSLNGEFKVSDDNWGFQFGCVLSKKYTISDAIKIYTHKAGGNFKADNLQNVTLKFSYSGPNPFNDDNVVLEVYANGKTPGAKIYESDPDDNGSGGVLVGDKMIGMEPTGTLPVLYINVYADKAKTTLNDEILSRNLSHKNYFEFAYYWLDTKGCEWLEADGATNLGTAEKPLALQIKARGNYTRTGFSKKPFKLKLDKKAEMLGLSNSKHFALLAAADDNMGYMRNVTGFDLGRRIGLPWTPWQQPVEVVINGDYRGLYFLTESIRIDKKRVNIEELNDEETTPGLVSGGYIVELDNYDEDESAQIQMSEKSCVGGWSDKLRITFDTPEVYSPLQRRFITDQFTAMNDAVGSANTSNALWAYMDMDDAARYYIVEELISHVESYHGSTYLFRDRGEGQKWHFSPLWDCGNAFNGPTNDFFYNHAPFGCTWIASIRQNAAFNAKVKETWMWFMNNGYKGITDDLAAFADHVTAAAARDHARWKNAPLPDYTGSNSPTVVQNNTDMASKLSAVVNHLTSKAEWLKSQFGDYTKSPNAQEPKRDATSAAPLPFYASEAANPVTVYFVDRNENPWNNVHAYLWGGGENRNDEMLGTWPGMAMEPVVDEPEATIMTVAEDYPTWKITFTPTVELNSDHRVIFHNNTNDKADQTDSYEFAAGSTYGRTSGETTGIEAPEAIDASAAQWFNLQGIRVANPMPGQTYIRVQGTEAKKVRLR